MNVQISANVDVAAYASSIVPGWRVWIGPDSALKPLWTPLEQLGRDLAAINSTILGLLPIALPSRGKQQVIVAQLDEQTSKIDTLTAECRELIALLKGRRSALITAAVTGKIDVHDDGVRVS